MFLQINHIQCVDSKSFRTTGVFSLYTGNASHRRIASKSPTFKIPAKSFDRQLQPVNRWSFSCAFLEAVRTRLLVLLALNGGTEIATTWLEPIRQPAIEVRAKLAIVALTDTIWLSSQRRSPQIAFQMQSMILSIKSHTTSDEHQSGMIHWS